MIADSEVNFIYFSEKLKTDSAYQKTFTQLKAVLDANAIDYGFLPNTNDIWARDYMPIQASDHEFVEYRFDPDYLQAVKYRSDKTYPDIVCDTMKLKTKKSNVILDGGNVIKSKNAVILTDKVVKENENNYSKNELIDKLQKLFHVEKVILIPWDKDNDIYGHADGMIRFIDDGNVIINGYIDSYSDDYKDRFYKALKQNMITCIGKLNYNVSGEEDEMNWAYINYLQTKDILILPKLGIEEDQQAMEQMCKIYPQYEKENKIVQVDVVDIVVNGGALNCISWTIKK